MRQIQPIQGLPAVGVVRTSMDLSTKNVGRYFMNQLRNPGLNIVGIFLSKRFKVNMPVLMTLAPAALAMLRQSKDGTLIASVHHARLDLALTELVLLLPLRRKMTVKLQKCFGTLLRTTVTPTLRRLRRSAITTAIVPVGSALMVNASKTPKRVRVLLL